MNNYHTMEAKKIYDELEKFITPEVSDKRESLATDPEITSYIADNFKQRYMWLVTDNTDNINQAFTAVFLNKKIVNDIIQKDVYNALIFTHHPMHRDITNPSVFTNLPKALFDEIKRRNISAYTLHTPLDKNGPYSTSSSLAEALGLKKIGEFGDYFGIKAWIIGKTESTTIQDLAKKFEEVLWHEVKIYPYGNEKIQNQTVGVIAGGWLDLPFLKELDALGINTLVTWISSHNDYSKARHDFAKEHKINIIGWTHYSTEKFAVQKMVDYFKKLWLPAEFIDDFPVMEDM